VQGRGEDHVERMLDAFSLEGRTAVVTQGLGSHGRFQVEQIWRLLISIVGSISYTVCTHANWNQRKRPHSKLGLWLSSSRKTDNPNSEQYDRKDFA